MPASQSLYTDIKNLQHRPGCFDGSNAILWQPRENSRSGLRGMDLWPEQKFTILYCCMHACKHTFVPKGSTHSIWKNGKFRSSKFSIHTGSLESWLVDVLTNCPHIEELFPQHHFKNLLYYPVWLFCQPLSPKKVEQHTCCHLLVHKSGFLSMGGRSKGTLLKSSLI